MLSAGLLIPSLVVAHISCALGFHGRFSYLGRAVLSTCSHSYPCKLWSYCDIQFRFLVHIFASLLPYIARAYTLTIFLSLHAQRPFYSTARRNEIFRARQRVQGNKLCSQVEGTSEKLRCNPSYVICATRAAYSKLAFDNLPRSHLVHLVSHSVRATECESS